MIQVDFVPSASGLESERQEQRNSPTKSELVAALSEFATASVAAGAVGDILDDLLDRAISLTGVAGAGVSLQQSGKLQFATAFNETSVSMEKAQEEFQQGPCVDAWRVGQPVVATDLAKLSARWSTYAKTAITNGFAAVAGIPMGREPQGIGVMSLYSITPRIWTGEELEIAGVLADMATSFVVSVSELDQNKRIIGQLEGALASRIVIEQAKGILAAERKITVEEAFRVLRAHARDHGANLHAVCDAVVNIGLRP